MKRTLYLTYPDAATLPPIGNAIGRAYLRTLSLSQAVALLRILAGFAARSRIAGRRASARARQAAAYPTIGPLRFHGWGPCSSVNAAAGGRIVRPIRASRASRATRCALGDSEQPHDSTDHAPWAASKMQAVSQAASRRGWPRCAAT